MPSETGPETYVHAPTRGRPDDPEPGLYVHAPNHGPAFLEPERVAEPEPESVVGPEPERVAAPEPDDIVEQPEPLAEPEPEPVATAEAPEPFAGPLPASIAAEPVAAPDPVFAPEPSTPAVAAAAGAMTDPPPRPRFVPRPEPYDPPPARRFDVARWLRSLAGVDERLLRSVWFERARHTALGGIILGTGLIAGLSMWTALNAAFGYESLLHLLPALIWLIFIVSLDRALVSTMFGAGRRWGAFLMRLALAVMFGFIIAEPLTIRIFQTAIEEHIRDERTQELADLQSSLLACNSKEVATGTAPAPAGCATFLLSFDQTPIADEAQLTTLREEEAKLAATVTADDAELTRLTEIARQECAGTSGVGLTGERGYGPECRDRNRDVNNFTATHPMQANAGRLAALRAEIATLSGQVAQSQAAFEQTRDELIAARVEEVRSHQGPIGLLERMNALHELASTSAALFIGTWAVRLFFVLADCLPVVVKFSGGASEYDKVLRAQAAGSVRRHAQEVQILGAEADHHVQRHQAGLDLELQEHRAELSLRRGEAVQRVSDQLLGPRH